MPWTKKRNNSWICVYIYTYRYIIVMPPGGNIMLQIGCIMQGWNMLKGQNGGKQRAKTTG